MILSPFSPRLARLDVHSPEPVKSLLSLLVCTAALSAGSASGAPVQPRFGIQQGLKAGAGTETSSNWAGYAVANRKPFTSVTGKWVQPVATCADLSSTYSAFWVGLGGFDDSSQALEQTGTEANCSAAGRATYTVWYELVPAGPVTVKMVVRPGDAISATVGERPNS